MGSLRRLGLYLGICLGMVGCSSEEPQDAGVPAAQNRVAVLPGEIPLVVIVVDTLRKDHVTPEFAPNITALGLDGIVFSQAFSHAPMTLPSHTALFSSTYPSGNGVAVNGQVVPPDLPLLAPWLLDLGYQTLAVASMATLWGQVPDEALDRGFQTFQHVYRDYSHGPETTQRIGSVLDAEPASPLFLFAHFADPHEPYRDFDPGSPKLQLRVDGELLTEGRQSHSPHLDATVELKAGDHVLSLVSEQDFVMRSLYVTHQGDGTRIPMEYTKGKRLTTLRAVEATFTLAAPGVVEFESWVNDKPTQLQARQRYTQEVGVSDGAVGALLEDLKRRGLYDQALIVFTSDHGEAFGEHQWNGHSESLFDELLHVPLIIKPPASGSFDGARRRLGQRSARLVRHVDVVPTVLELLDLAVMPGMVGQSLVSDDWIPAPHLAETHKPEASQDQLCLRDANHKLIYSPETESFILFDLIQDPAETVDLFGAQGHDFEAWQDELRHWAKQSDRDPLLPDPAFDERIDALGY